MNNNDIRNLLENKLNNEGFPVKIEKPVGVHFKVRFGKPLSKSIFYNREWINTDILIKEEGLLIKKFLIKFNDIRTIDLIKPQLFSSGYIELTDYYDNYFKIKASSQFLIILFEILKEKLNN
ncbi:MAG: hypothetical protein Q4P18_06820 [Methanobrevibacter sp.]|uniref:hypothetical protein n=1 Tax=Methanobrevibacter sp. TaxID=66852 RepID=UPI0026E02267|nr:hypothetical protein [Methanobrevibacter sp.]MDO5849229.1 hypothetical protein [Methanobrevibacter sp.]